MKKAFNVKLIGITHLDEAETQNYVSLANTRQEAQKQALQYAKHNLKYWLMKLKYFSIDSTVEIPSTDFYEEEDFRKQFKELGIA